MCKNVDNDVSKDPPYSYQLILTSTAKPRLFRLFTASNQRGQISKKRDEGKGTSNKVLTQYCLVFVYWNYYLPWIQVLKWSTNLTLLLSFTAVTQFITQRKSHATLPEASRCASAEMTVMKTTLVVKKR